jgi:hypothetical protein
MDDRDFGTRFLIGARHSVPHIASYKMGPGGFFDGTYRPGSEADHSRP